MFKGGRGGFASYTKTGRNIAMGRSFGAAMARGTSSSSRSDNNEEPTAFVKFMLVFTCLYIIHTINQILKQKQL
jgi:hypothetical protein